MKFRIIVAACFFSVVLWYCFGVSAMAQDNALSKELNVYNWEDYFGQTTLKDFEKEFGVKVNLYTFKDEESMISGIQSDPSKYDVIIGSGDTLRDVIAMRLLAEINLANIPNFKNIEKKYRGGAYDPHNKFTIPYLWGTSGIAFNTKYVTENTNSWQMLWNPKYKGKIAMLNNSYEAIDAALKCLGYSLNSSDPKEFEEVIKKVFEQHALLAGYFDPIKIRDKLVANELWAAQIYSGEGMSAADKNSAIKYIIPKEGAAIWVDCFAVPRDAPHKYTAEVFINYILEPKTSAKIVNYLWYANCNIAARPYTLKEILNNSSLYPPQDVLDKCEFWVKRGAGTEEEQRFIRQIHNKIWSELQLKKR